MNQDRIQKIKDFYKKRLNNFEKNWEDRTYLYGWRNPIGLYMRQRIQRYLIEMLNKHNLFLAEKRILDIGCGYGHWLRFFAEIRGNSQELAGLDISPQRISKAKALSPRGIELIIGDAVSLPFADESFDIVTQFDTFEHLVDEAELKKAAHELVRVLRENGFLLWFDLLPFAECSDLIRGYSLKEVKALFPEFKLLDYKPIFKKFNLIFKNISAVYRFPKFSFMLTDLVEKVPFGNYSNLLILMQKKNG